MNKHRALLLILGFGLWGSSALSILAADWPQWHGPSRDGVWHDSDIIESFPDKQLEILWEVPISSGYSSPTVAAGLVYLFDLITEPNEMERIHCFEETTGKPVWQFKYKCIYKGIGYKAGPRAAILIHDGLSYSLGAMGDLHCLDAKTGKVTWQKDLNALYQIEMPKWGIAAAPIIYKQLVIVQACGKDACFVAFDRKTGKEVWRALSDRAGYSAPIMIKQAGRDVMVLWTGDQVAGLNPEDGKLFWTYPFISKRTVLNPASPVFKNNYLFFTAFYQGALLLKVDPNKMAVEKVWRRKGPNENNTDSLHSIISTPLIKGDAIYGVDSYGELRCLDLLTGDRIWENLDMVPKTRWGTIHFVTHNDKVWMFNERGELIITTLSRKGVNEISRTQLIQPTRVQLNKRDGVCWSHPAYANGHVFARNDEKLVAARLRK